MIDTYNILDIKEYRIQMGFGQTTKSGNQYKIYIHNKEKEIKLCIILLTEHQYTKH